MTEKEFITKVTRHLEWLCEGNPCSYFEVGKMHLVFNYDKLLDTISVTVGSRVTAKRKVVAWVSAQFIIKRGTEIDFCVKELTRWFNQFK